MPVTNQNTSAHRVVLRLNSGQTRHLPPGTVATGLPDAEVRGNAQIRRLEGRRAIQTRSTPRASSTDLTAREAISHIRDTPLEALEGFVAEGEDRKTVLEAWEEKQGSR